MFFKSGHYTTVCPKNMLNLRIKTEPATAAGAGNGISLAFVFRDLAKKNQTYTVTPAVTPAPTVTDQQGVYAEIKNMFGAVWSQ